MPRDKTGHFYFAWYPTIYQQDTQDLTLAEDGAYRRLIDHYMLTRAPLPRGDKALARIVGIGHEEWQAVRTAVLCFFKDTGVHYAHTFCDSVLSGDTARILKAQSNGSKGGRPSHSNKKEITQSVTESNPVGSPNQTNHTKTDKTNHNGKGGEGGERGFLQGVGFAGGLEFRPDLDTADKLMAIAPGWDQHFLISAYNDWKRARGLPTADKPQEAFLGWARKFTKGKRPA